MVDRDLLILPLSLPPLREGWWGGMYSLIRWGGFGPIRHPTLILPVESSPLPVLLEESQAFNYIVGGKQHNPEVGVVGFKTQSKPPTPLYSRSDDGAVAAINAEAAAVWRSRRVTQRHFPSIHRRRGLHRFSGRFFHYLSSSRWGFFKT